MPPKVRFSRNTVLNAAFALTRAQGLDAVNARAIAKELGCSTQPIFREFSGMDALREEMHRMALDQYNTYIRESSKLATTAYKATGLAYILFARDEPQLFKLIFMRDRIHDGTSNRIEDENIDYILGTICARTGFDRTQALLLHQHMSIYTHGLAVMVATGYAPYQESEFDHLLSEEYLAMLAFLRQKQAP